MGENPVYMEETPENWITPWNDPSHYLKYHLQLKREIDVGSVLGGDQEKVRKEG